MSFSNSWIIVTELSQGIADKFTWGVEQSGAQRSYRIMQKRGVIVDADDFHPVTSTYPEHPLSKVVPKVANKEELKEARLNSYRKAIGSYNELNESAKKNIRGDSLTKTYIKSEFLIEKPTHTSINQIKANDKIQARKRVNLTDGVHDQKDEVGAPSLNYIVNPKMKQMSELVEHRRAQMLVELKRNEANFATHQDGQARIIAREDCNLRKLSTQAPSRTTMAEIKEKRRADMIMENVNKFGEQTIGIHGQELPKYSQNEDSKEWWKYANSLKEPPKVQSRVLLKQNQKFWATNDEMLLADKSYDMAPIDIFKQTHVPKAGEKLVPDKPNSLTHCKNEDMLAIPEMKKGFKKQAKWTKDFKDFECIGERRLMDKTLEQAKQKEQAEIERESKLAAYFKQPQRGRRRNTVDPNEQLDVPIQQPGP